MGYYTRVLTTEENCMPVSEIEKALAEGHLSSRIEVEDGSETDWERIVLMHEDGTEIAVVERNPVAEGSLGAEELEEFREELHDAKPLSGAEWLQTFFPRIKCIYAFQHLSGTEKEKGFEILEAARNALWAAAPAIIQADNEGFTNEEGYHILWQFSEGVSGPWWMGLLRNGTWVPFEMDLGNEEQRSAFLRGEVPNGVRFA
jgi:hypothetical protein